MLFRSARGNPPGNANFSERVPEWFLKNREPKFVVLSSFGKSSLMKLALSLVIAAFPLISGCTTIMSVSVSEIHPNNQTIISADDFGTGIFRLTTPDLHVMDKLRRQCPEGMVSGVETHLTVTDILLIVQQWRLHADAYCSKKQN